MIRNKLLIFLVNAVVFAFTNGFFIQQQIPTRTQRYAKITPTKRAYALHMVSNSVIPSEPGKVVDNNGAEFTAECTIQTSSEIRAFHVQPKAFGSFDEESKSFVPLNAGGRDMKEVPRSEKCLIIPKGMRGTVRSVYDISEFDATSPILAKFEADNAFDGDYAPPVTFLMHFQSHEVEVVK